MIRAALGTNVQVSSSPITASAKPIDEMCPSPMQRRAIATLSWSGARPSCDGCTTALGLQSAAPSTAYSAVNAAPSTRAWDSVSRGGIPDATADRPGVGEEQVGGIRVSFREIVDDTIGGLLRAPRRGSRARERRSA
jgi:hypothetical protein